MVKSVDDSVGRVLAKLKEAGLDENTIVVFTSDNGGLGWATDNRPLRSGKGWLYEGGVRVPLLVRVPGETDQGSVNGSIIRSTDVMPTLLDLAGVGVQPELHADGESFEPVIRGEREVVTPDVVWHYPHYHGQGWSPGAAIRRGDWKLIAFYHDDKVELYNLADDPNEERDISREHPAVTAELLNALRAWQAQTGAKMPTVRKADRTYRVLEGAE